MIRLEVAGFICVFQAELSVLLKLIKRRYKSFLVQDQFGLIISLATQKGAALPFKPRVLFKGTALKLKRGDFNAEIDLSAGSGWLTLAPTEQCFDAFLRTLLSSLLLSTGGMLLHSSGIVKNGKAYLFLGKSGAGKSTLSKTAQSAGYEVISDELNLLRREKGRYIVYGSPFWGEMRNEGRQGAWPLGGIYVIKKSKATAQFSLATGEALKVLLRCLMNFSKDKEAAAQALLNAAALMSKYKIHGLELQKNDPEFIGLLK